MRFFFDEHVSRPAAHALVKRGVDVEHITDVGMARASDPEVLEYAIEHGRILVTRNYKDFAPLVQALNRMRRPFPGVLFLAHSIPPGDPGSHVRAIEDWIRGCPPGVNLVENTYLWIR
ncbi:MAG TPA: DUF5615 family PIN-like protein [Longimicrobium sp.]|nr:DUF5615 family PIN-like protein [Longimicrobium sp.]